MRQKNKEEVVALLHSASDMNIQDPLCLCATMGYLLHASGCGFVLCLCCVLQRLKGNLMGGSSPPNQQELIPAQSP